MEILIRAVLLFTAVNALQHQSLDSYSSADDCALILDGPGRTSIYDYTYNLLRGSQ